MSYKRIDQAHGKIADGYRFPVECTTLTATDKPAKSNPYIANGEIVSLFFIINAADLNEAGIKLARILNTCFNDGRVSRLVDV